MKKMDYQNVRGTQDYLPIEERTRRKIRRTLEDIFIQYGCEPLETPILNYTELLASKYAGGSEILKEMYRLSDRGERDLSLRYDLTIPYAKVIAMNPELRMPFKRYEIGKVFRDGPIKKGRLREFTQCDVDIVGVSSVLAEAELMMMALDIFRQLDLPITIQYNNRKLLTGLLSLFGVDDNQLKRSVLALDKLEKIGIEAVLIELEELVISSEALSLIRKFLLSENNTEFEFFNVYAEQSKQVAEGLEELQALNDYLEYLGVTDRCIFNPLLARGLEIYSGTVYEIFLTNQEITSSVGSGGRYDNTIGGLIGSDESIPTVGISFGLDVIYVAIANSQKQIGDTDLDYYIISLGCERESLAVATKLRHEGYAVEIAMRNRKLGKELKKANQEKVRTVIIIGEDEVTNNQYRERDLVTGVETLKSFLF